jgi:hypothetical protein
MIVEERACGLCRYFGGELKVSFFGFFLLPVQALVAPSQLRAWEGVLIRTCPLSLLRHQPAKLVYVYCYTNGIRIIWAW